MEIKMPGEPRQPVSIAVNDIPLGMVFRGLGDNGVYLKVYDNLIVDLADPEYTYSNLVSVENYVPLRAHLVIEGEL